MRHSTDERCCGVSSLCEIKQAQTRKHEHRRRSDFAQSAYDPERSGKIFGARAKSVFQIA